MLKVRVIPTLLYKNNLLVKGVAFDSWRPVGGAMQSIKVYNLRDVDELIFVDITATNEQREPDFSTIDELADECFMPFTVGGGIRGVDDVRRLLQVGADKVAIGTRALENPKLVEAIAKRFGSQCVVVSIDAKKTATGYEVYTHSGTRPSTRTPAEVARIVENAGAGEVLLTSIDRDGTMTGYDLELIQSVTSEIKLPVIASGGAGNYDHLVAAVRDAKASAVAAAAMFHFTQQTPLEAKRHLAAAGIPVRL
jgi:cyclase